MATRDLERARLAYEIGDTEESRKAHLIHHKQNERHSAGGDFIKSFTYGGLDGILTTFSIVAGSIGSSLGVAVIVILGLSNVFSDGLAMSFGDYLSTKSEQEYQKSERARETWEVENNPEGEMIEMEELYKAKGMSDEDAKAMTEILSRNKEAWVNVMMVEELGIMEENESPVKNGLVTFFSFVVFGIFPLIPFLIALAFDNPAPHTIFWFALAVTGVILFVLGAVKTKVTGANPLKSGIETLIIGGIAAGSAYLIGWLLEPLVHDK